MVWKCVHGVAPAHLSDLCVPTTAISDRQHALYWFHAPGQQLDNEVSQSTDQPHWTVCHQHYGHRTCQRAPSNGHWRCTCSRLPGAIETFSWLWHRISCLLTCPQTDTTEINTTFTMLLLHGWPSSSSSSSSSSPLTWLIASMQAPLQLFQWPLHGPGMHCFRRSEHRRRTWRFFASWKHCYTRHPLKTGYDCAIYLLHSVNCKFWHNVLYSAPAAFFAIVSL